MKRFELIEHTAIPPYRLRPLLPEAFANAAYGMFSIMTDLETVREVESRHVEVNSDDIEGLLFEWLNSLLYYFGCRRSAFQAI